MFAAKVYARIWSTAVKRYIEDGIVDAVERRHLDALKRCLQRLGWTEGRV